jgi:GrpB-like predicted nucleotidyltransferase (UPF0157 family)
MYLSRHPGSMEDHDAILVVEHDSRWRGMFETERDALAKALIPGTRIHHVGSTSVPGLAAKPIIDIMVCLERMSRAEEVDPLLAPFGYVNVPQEEDEVRLFYRKGMPRTHHLHVVQAGGDEEHRHLAFRDHLRSHPEAVERYAELKRRLAEEHAHDRPAYCEGKAGLITTLMREALEEFSREHYFPTTV